MISNYLTVLYSNCKVLSKTKAHKAGELEPFFKNKIAEGLIQLKFTTEIELIDYLRNVPYSQIQFFLNSNPFVYMFYLVNSVNELNNTQNYDELGRSQFMNSLQEEIGIEKNKVLELILNSVNENKTLQDFFRIENHTSYFFLSHDIDSLYGSLLQDGAWALKNKRFDVLLKLFTNVLIAKPDWFNIDLIMKLESEHDFKSTFYWIVNKGKVDQRQTNADYAIASQKLSKILDKVEEKGFENGLHKSVSSQSFKEELSKFPKKTVGNRYHYLKFNLPHGYDQVENSGLKMDASLGYAEQFGFRNNYGYPFSPYNFKTQNNYSFLEVPLTIMDGTFQRYMKVPVNKTAEKVIGFLEQNKQNCLLSILWHNTFFTNYKYKGYRQEYINILKYLRDEKFININQSQIIEQFSWTLK